jgi:hypothetical protein
MAPADSPPGLGMHVLPKHKPGATIEAPSHAAFVRAACSCIPATAVIRSEGMLSCTSAKAHLNALARKLSTH